MMMRSNEEQAMLKAELHAVVTFHMKKKEDVLEACYEV